MKIKLTSISASAKQASNAKLIWGAKGDKVIASAEALKKNAKHLDDVSISLINGILSKLREPLSEKEIVKIRAKKGIATLAKDLGALEKSTIKVVQARADDLVNVKALAKLTKPLDRVLENAISGKGEPAVKVPTSVKVPKVKIKLKEKSGLSEILKVEDSVLTDIFKKAGFKNAVHNQGAYQVEARGTHLDAAIRFTKHLDSSLEFKGSILHVPDQANESLFIVFNNGSGMGLTFSASRTAGKYNIGAMTPKSNMDAPEDVQTNGTSVYVSIEGLNKFFAVKQAMTLSIPDTQELKRAVKKFEDFDSKLEAGISIAKFRGLFTKLPQSAQDEFNATMPALQKLI